MMGLYRNPSKCAACGGKCCKIYLPAEDGGAWNTTVYFEDWCMGFHPHPEEYGISPLFDPLIVHLTGNEHLLKELREKDIDPDACQYLGKDGCMIPWDKRPLICRTWKCEKFDESDLISVVRLDFPEPTSISSGRRA